MSHYCMLRNKYSGNKNYCNELDKNSRHLPGISSKDTPNYLFLCYLPNLSQTAIFMCNSNPESVDEIGHVQHILYHPSVRATT